MNSISLDVWESIEKDVGVGANGSATHAAVILKIQQLRSSVIHNLFYEIGKMSLIKELGQEAETFGYQLIEKNHCIFGSGSDPNDITSIVAQ